MKKTSHAMVPVYKKTLLAAVSCLCLGLSTIGCDIAQTITTSVRVEGDGVIRDITTGWDSDNGGETITTDTETSHVFIASFSLSSELEAWYYNSEFLSSEDTVEVTFRQDNDTLIARFIEKQQEGMSFEECQSICSSAAEGCVGNCLELYDIETDMTMLDKFLECSANCDTVSQECMRACETLQ